MSRIALLDEATIGLIAAGEVVERPVSVVKELLENSVDAGATRISVVVEGGGRDRITVVDDGVGMDRDDAVLSLQRHATSKLRAAGELPGVQTLGFRGEALASIAAVSHLEMVTRARGADAGVRLLARGGVIADLREVGTPEGTRISVEQLFFNSPVRRRYLRSAATELGYLCDCVAQCALAHPEVAFSLAHGGETVFHHGGSGALLDAVVAAFGADAARRMLPVAAPGEQCTLTGYLSHPTLTRGTRAWQWFFVNGRPIQSRVLAHALEQGYHGLITAGRFPVAALLLRLDPALVDVNVHPAKREVRFLAEGDLHRFLSRAVRETLEAADLMPRVSGDAGGTPLLPEARPCGDALSPSPLSPPAPEAAPPTLPLEWTPPTVAAVPQARAQIHDTYILAEGPEGLFIIDQHTAHERSLFEQLLSGDAEALLQSLPLAVPFVLSLAPREAAAAREHLEALREAGFQVEPFGGDAFLVRAVPAALARGDAETVLRDALEDLLRERPPQSLEARREKIASLLACRGAVKAGDRLTLQEMQAILRGLYALRSHATCQHGRPTVILLSRDELEKRFQR